jgi:hypothetical protein
VESGIEFEWDEDNINHLWQHKVRPDEFEDVMLNEAVKIIRLDPAGPNSGGYLYNQGRSCARSLHTGPAEPCGHYS